MKRLYLRMVYLTVGLIIYIILLIGCYIYFFIAGGKDITNTFAWIIVHELLGHIVLYTTFYSYLRIKRHYHYNDNTENGNNNISGNKNIGHRISVTRSHRGSSNQNINKYYLKNSVKPKYYNPNSVNNNSNPNIIVNGVGGVSNNKYYQNSNDDFFNDDDMSDYRKYGQIHRESQSDQTEIMSISANDEAGQQYNSYKNTAMQYSMMPYGQIPPVNFQFSPNGSENNNVNNNNLNKSNSFYQNNNNGSNYENFLI